MTDEALEQHERKTLEMFERPEDKTTAYDVLRRKADARGFSSVNDLIDSYDAMKDER